ncbi:transmembrane protein 242 [Leptopilina heterotoma]|uniref:transmembrane protein 242 n=1 Tax=Leptopilina heterotoma TaxID=63436 RepID=UPI001CAA1CA2|nr:transmembrane protein 242 [Leptopilina heterotoma]
MSSESNVLIPKIPNINSDIQTVDKLTNKDVTKRKEKFKAVAFVSAITGFSFLIGFGSTLAVVRKQDQKYFQEGIVGVKGGLHDSGASLALRALGWGTLYAFTGCGLLFYGIWKLSGAKNAEEFRHKMGSILPRIPKNDPPQSRTEFDGLTDLLKYISEDWGTENDPARRKKPD